ncbi:hypothetical protein L1857_31750 [Amycolatopsis thermalba]|uniref:Preprotein translocase subunit TatC n=1 Tax=Amycolatopsis thermalba TaxID=944492 RepID=A0ABY4P3V7_9PSEU|nr:MULTISPECIES: hypothetical protein [Amycolatopsis]UQS27050.1 hypothetical protein L1857_31750 [Amycolatopsis thermalba]
MRKLRWLVLFPFVVYLYGPFWLARKLFGPYELLNLFKFSTKALPSALRPDDALGQAVDVALERVLTTRALVAAGLLALVLRFAVDPRGAVQHLDEAFDDALTDGFFVLIIAPIAVVFLVPLLVAISRERTETARAGLWPVGVGVFGFALLCAFFEVPVPPVRDAVRAVIRFVTFDSFPMPLIDLEVERLHPLAGAALVWLLLFVVGVAYLAHRNGLARRGFRQRRRLAVLAPLVSVVVVWTTLICKFAWDFPGFAGLSGWRLAVIAYSTPVAATLVAAYELRQLARAEITLRQPVLREPPRSHPAPAAR